MSTNEELVQAVFDTFNERDLEGATAIVTDDFELVDVGAGLTLRGKTALRQWYEGFLAAGPDGLATLHDVVIGEDSAASEHTGTFTQTGPLLTPGGEIPATGRRVELPIAECYYFQDGKIAVMHAYYDVATILQQLGLMPQGNAVST